jgi:mannosyltransferase OCH1-like enzyme
VGEGSGFAGEEDDDLGVLAADPELRAAAAAFADDLDGYQVASELPLVRRALPFVPESNVSLAASTRATDNTTRQPRIPRIIHQTWKTDVLPERWEAVRQGCVDLHPD